jgi:hypothetical protein
MFLWIVIIVVTCVCLAGILRAVIVPKGPFPSCKRCRYDVGSLQLPTKCPECGTELVPATVLTAREAAARIPSGEGVGLCVLVIALMWIALGVVFFDSSWPWYSGRSSRTTEYHAMRNLAKKGDGISAAGGVWPDRSVFVSYDFNHIDGEPAYRGSVTITVGAVGGASASVSLDPSGSVVSADNAAGIVKGSSLQVETTRALYRAAGFDVDSEPLLAAEADLLYEAVVALLSDPSGRRGRPTGRVVAAGGANQVWLTSRSSFGSSGPRLAVLPVGGVRVPVGLILLVASVIAVPFCLRAALRQRQRVVEHMARVVGVHPV